MNVAEKILARASGRSSVEPGEIVIANVDRLIMHDLSGYLTAGVFDKQVGGKVRYPDRVVLVFDHHFSPPTEQQAKVLQSTRDWARRQGVHLFDCGSGNIHHVLVRRGLVKPGMIVVGSDSHTPVHGTVGALAVALGNDSHAGTVMPYGKAWFKVPHTVRVELSGTPQPGATPRDIALWLVARIGEGELNYASIEFAGPYVKQLEFWDRWLFPLLCVDLGAKCAFVETSGTGEPAQVLRFDVGEVGPQVACPPTVGNVRPVPEIAGKAIDWAELGGHGGGRLEDIRAAASILDGRKVHPSVRFNIVPSSREVFTEAAQEGLVLALHEAGATWFPPSTGSNQAINMGAMAPGEAMISTHSRNFPGRNGSPEAEMFLASAATVAASAVAGTITEAGA
jgi:3-isopropylmalate/(R)-2-methylmalate dehydratase large subunit